MLHVFSFADATRTFESIAQQDPECGMAYWGLAASAIGSLYGGRPGPQESQGEQAAEKAAIVSAKTPRERGYIAAIGVFYKDKQNVAFANRLSAYANALKELHERYPKDPEAEIFYAYALSALGSPTDRSLRYEREGAEILERLFREHPNHPGIAHYLLHCYDHTSLASRGIDAARRMGRIAPESPHAAQFPAHIFTRVGLWQEAIQASQAGADFRDDVFFKPHAMDFLIYSYLQTGQDEAAGESLKRAAQLKIIPHILDAYAAAAMPSRYAIERHRWDEAAALQLPTVDIDWKRFPHAEAALVFSRALGAARLGDIAAAQKDLMELQDLRARLIGLHDAEGVWQTFWVSEVEINEEMVRAWILHRQGEHNAALQLLSRAADKEDSTEIDPVMPGTIISARQLLGEMLLESGHPKEALRAFEAALETEPARYWAWFGAARSAELSGNQELAILYYTQLLRQTQSAGATRDTTRIAEAFLAQHGIFMSMGSNSRTPGRPSSGSRHETDRSSRN
jgi:tetratricopeptide (TPR) repeat protein